MHTWLRTTASRLLFGSLLLTLGTVGCAPPGETMLPPGGCKPPQVGKLQTLELSAGMALTTVGTGASLGIATADLNADSYADLVVSQSTDGSVGVLLGRGDGTFKDPVRHAAGRGAGPLLVRDLDTDGKADVAVVNTLGDEVAILRGRGDGTLDVAVPTLVGFSPNALAPGDFDGDGKLDLAVAVGDMSLNLMRGEGDGRFNAPTGYMVFSPQRSVIGADLDANGKLDVVFLHGQNPEARVLVNNGGAMFQPMQIVVLPALGKQLVTADFDKDGKADLLVTHPDMAQGTLLRGKGDGTFAMAATVSLEKPPAALAVADA